MLLARVTDGDVRISRKGEASAVSKKLECGSGSRKVTWLFKSEHGTEGPHTPDSTKIVLRVERGRVRGKL
jgi:hypothetical protein